MSCALAANGAIAAANAANFAAWLPFGGESGYQVLTSPPLVDADVACLLLRCLSKALRGAGVLGENPFAPTTNANRHIIMNGCFILIVSCVAVSNKRGILSKESLHQNKTEQQTQTDSRKLLQSMNPCAYINSMPNSIFLRYQRTDQIKGMIMDLHLHTNCYAFKKIKFIQLNLFTLLLQQFARRWFASCPVPR